MTEEPDFAILLSVAGRCLTDRLLAAVAGSGVEGMRSSYGFVLRAIAEEGRTLTELAALLGVTKQATQRVVDEMEQRGLVERTPRAGDRRAKELRLTPLGQKARKAALAASEAIETELEADLGADAVAATRAALLRFIEREGGLDDALARRARPVW